MASISIYADEVSFVNLLKNPRVQAGANIKEILKKRSAIYLAIEKAELQQEWQNTESDLRYLCDAIDLPCPQAVPELWQIIKDPEDVCKYDPFAFWFFNLIDEDIQAFIDHYGVYFLNAKTIDDNALFLDHKKSYYKDERISGYGTSGWDNFFEYVRSCTHLPPLNAMVISDRYLLANRDKNNDFCGLKNLLWLLDALLPRTLDIPFELLIYCRLPSLIPKKNADYIPQKHKNGAIKQFIDGVHGLRDYKIGVKFVFAANPPHERMLYSNYFSFNTDRGYNTFYINAPTKLCGENKLLLEAYTNNPNCTGDFNFDMAKKELGRLRDIYEDSPHTLGDPQMPMNCLLQ